jgi:hypothetical protein
MIKSLQLTRRSPLEDQPSGLADHSVFGFPGSVFQRLEWLFLVRDGSFLVYRGSSARLHHSDIEQDSRRGISSSTEEGEELQLVSGIQQIVQSPAAPVDHDNHDILFRNSQSDQC